MGVEKSGNKFTKDGSVVRITMKNFMTYKHETIWPGKKRKFIFFEVKFRFTSPESFQCETGSSNKFGFVNRHTSAPRI
jgi:hypothetical protein